MPWAFRAVSRQRPARWPVRTHGPSWTVPPPPVASNAEQGQRHKLERQPRPGIFWGPFSPGGVWRDGSKPRHNQSATWPRSESVSRASHPSVDLSRRPRPRRAPGDSHGTLHPARHVSQC